MSEKGIRSRNNMISKYTTSDIKWLYSTDASAEKAKLKNTTVYINNQEGLWRFFVKNLR